MRRNFERRRATDTLRSLVILSVLLGGAQALGAQTSDLIRLNGYSSFEFERQFGDEGRGDSSGSFDADLFDLVINVTPTPGLRISADLTWEHGVATEDGRGNAAVEYAFAEYVVRDWLKVRAGKMFTHFGIYNEIHTAKPVFLTVKEPLATNKNDKFGSDLRFYPRWGTGIAFVGDSVLSGMDLDYVVQITNGEQEHTNPFEEDDNAAKAVAARLRLELKPGLRFGVSFYTDSLTERDAQGEDTGARMRLLSWGGQAEWTRDRLGVELEYVRGSVKPASGRPETRRQALSALASYRLGSRVTPYLRFEWLDPDLAALNDTARLFVYGLNLRVAQGLFVKAELDTIEADSSNGRFEGQGYTEFKAAIAVAF